MQQLRDVIRETPAAADRAVGASKTLRAFFCNFTSTPFLRTCVQIIYRYWNKLYNMWSYKCLTSYFPERKFKIYYSIHMHCKFQDENKQLSL
jgi:hypothetical protein